MIKLLAVIPIIMLSGCANNHSEHNLAFKALPQSELVQIENTHFDRFIVTNPKVFNQFNKIIFFPMQFDRLSISPQAEQSLRNSWNASNWQEMDAICQHFDEFAQKIFSERQGFSPTNTGGKDVLAVEFRLMDFMPYSKRYKDASLNTVGSSSNDVGLGTITFQAVIAHSQSGELIAVIEDGMEVNAGNKMPIKGDLSLLIESNNKASQNRAWRKVFKRWVSLFHTDLTLLQNLELAANNQ